MGKRKVSKKAIKAMLKNQKTPKQLKKYWRSKGY